MQRSTQHADRDHGLSFELLDNRSFIDQILAHCVHLALSLCKIRKRQISVTKPILFARRAARLAARSRVVMQPLMRKSPQFVLRTGGEKGEFPRETMA